MTLLAEDLLLLLLDDESGKRLSTYTDQAVGGALLVELALAGAVDVQKGSAWRRATVVTTGPLPAEADPLLTEAYATVAEKRRAASDLVGRLGKRGRPRLLERLEQRGLLERRDLKVLGLFPHTRWPAAETSHETALRRSLTEVLVIGREPDERTAALAALLFSVDLAHKVVRVDGVPARDVKRRAKELADGTWAADAVREVIRSMNAAVIAAVAAGAAAGGSS